MLDLCISSASDLYKLANTGTHLFARAGGARFIPLYVCHCQSDEEGVSE